MPPYPNYHVGDYFEEFFFKKFVSEYPDLTINGYKYLPIFWTNCYCNTNFANQSYEIQNIINELDSSVKYFTISQHDDCIYEKIPFELKVFSMGGNMTGDNIYPIPLICSNIDYPKKEKDIYVSFIGSLTHDIRNKIVSKFSNNNNFYIKTKSWEIESGKNNIDLFLDVTSRSKFTLCPRGYGKTSFRLYESMQLDSIPIYVYDEKWLPWSEDIDWDNLIISVHHSELDNLELLINNVDYKKMINYKNDIYKHYFTYDGVYDNIIKKIIKW
jgi:hypothetical protein